MTNHEPLLATLDRDSPLYLYTNDCFLSIISHVGMTMGDLTEHQEASAVLSWLYLFLASCKEDSGIDVYSIECPRMVKKVAQPPDG